MRTAVNDKIGAHISNGYRMIICSVNMDDRIIYIFAIPVNNHVDRPLIIFGILSFQHTFKNVFVLLSFRLHQGLKNLSTYQMKLERI